MICSSSYRLRTYISLHRSETASCVCPSVCPVQAADGGRGSVFEALGFVKITADRSADSMSFPRGFGARKRGSLAAAAVVCARAAQINWWWRLHSTSTSEITVRIFDHISKTLCGALLRRRPFRYPRSEIGHLFNLSGTFENREQSAYGTDERVN